VTGKVYAVVLAAGQSSRFGGKKLTRNLGGKPLLQLPLAAAQAAFPGNVVLVAGHEADAIIESSGGLANHVVVNPDYSEGQGSSIAAGVRACRKDADAIAILLADQPLVTSEILERLAAEWTGDERHIVASGIGDSLGPPVLFGKGAFDKLCELDGDVGAKKLLQSGEFDVARIAVGAASFDVDTSQDLEVVSQLLATEK
jgi:molybdenum cofactor cytidylyltransferase